MPTTANGRPLGDTTADQTETETSAEEEGLAATGSCCTLLFPPLQAGRQLMPMGSICLRASAIMRRAPHLVSVYFGCNVVDLMQSCFLSLSPPLHEHRLFSQRGCFCGCYVRQRPLSARRWCDAKSGQGPSSPSHIVSRGPEAEEEESRFFAHLRLDWEQVAEGWRVEIPSPSEGLSARLKVTK